MSKNIIGVDIGGTSIKLALLDIAGNLLEKWSIGTNISDNGCHIPIEIASSIKSRVGMRGNAIEDVLGIGIGVPGPVDDCCVKRAVNLGWQDFPLKKVIEQELNVPVVLLNDANAAALGEFWQGSVEQSKDIVFITIGTGVGGGVIVAGQIINGYHSSGGEIGHIPVKSEEKRICGCGNVNCLECYGSANGMVKTMNNLAGKKVVSEAKEVFEMIRDGNALAQEALSITIDYLAAAISGIINTLDPEELVIGGGVSESGELFIEPLKKALEEYVFPQIRGSVCVRKASLGNDAGIYGAAYQIINSLKMVPI
ncbi:ROK family protein [Enterococcus gilvus]|uniref:ROK family protein n=1 Tax=Enterococcus gilvus TaxID=160453 RepID=UPI003D6A430B